MSVFTPKKSPKEITDRIFFHDIINLTHGLLLFLGQKKATHQAINEVDILAIEREIKMLQTMLKEHYQYTHKNLGDSTDWISIVDSRPLVMGIVETYLGSSKIAYSINYKEESDRYLLHLPTFYRIMHNLIKNMAEAKSLSVQIDFIIENESLLIETKNTVESDKKVQSLEIVGGGLGIESVRLLTLLSQGRFSHEMINNLWCNHIVLPLCRNEFKKRDIKEAA